ncbi:response regulator [Oerskovia sp. NPDC060338]|uniref:response regulator n=1 Tax=Oerskovia sp. NPDC060338 TaxID=3347100 RepID=UPI00365972E8
MGTTPDPIRVFLLDDHEVVRRGVAALLEAEDDIQVVGEAGTAASALPRIRAVRPDIAVLDVRLPDGSGVEVCRDVRSEMPEIGCLMLTSFADDEALFQAVLAGASGYVLKQIHGSDLVGAVRTIAGGGSLLDPVSTARILDRLRTPQAQEVDRLEGLSPQERQIVDLIGEGMTNRQIGERLFLAEKTVKNYVSHILSTLGLQRRTQVAVLATELRTEDRPRG